jgi:hypothetical protein
MTKSPKRTDLKGKIVVLVMIRTPENRFVKGNKIRAFSIANQKVTTVANAIAPAIDGLRPKKVKAKK